MDAFDRLSPAMRYQIVNELGFRALRPVQELTTHAILDQLNCVVLAPTAGGKTESAFFPLLSAMDEGSWDPVSVLYIAPIRALLNNQHDRVTRYTRMIGRRAFTWHGDVKPAQKKAFLREPADVLLTTPESIEVMLVSPSVPARRLFAGLRAVVIDEVHAFVGDDRGGHMASLLERLSRYCGRDVQRIGLSATVGNPDEILRWLQGSSKREGKVVRGPGPRAAAEVTLDYVGSYPNAARVIAALHQGRKRLVFTQSRARAEELTRLLRTSGVDTYVSHSSLSLEERSSAERAFAEGSNCVIVATSALELGIDVGDLDHVLQVDAPGSVASFLQRMGRTGRREGAVPNCTILTLNDRELWQSAALLRLWSRGYVEPLRPPTAAAHLLAHQLMALSLQESGVATSDWWSWLSSAAPFRALSDDDRRELVEHMVEQDILSLEGGRLSLGTKGEKLYGYRHFAELYSVFASARALTVVAAGQEIGTIDSRWIEGMGDRQVHFTLAGRLWRVISIDWTRAQANVVASEQVKSAVWLGDPKILPRVLCAEQRKVAVDREVDPWWTSRARTAMETVRDEFGSLTSEGPLWIESDRGIRLWTFAGWHGNATIAGLYEHEFGRGIAMDNLALNFTKGTYRSAESLYAWVDELRAARRPNAQDALSATIRHFDDRLSKFQPCLPPRLVRKLVADTHFDHEAAREALGE
jgi:ATP-dependent Lhr-like helicase